jgi:hypothetical protein
MFWGSVPSRLDRGVLGRILGRVYSTDLLLSPLLLAFVSGLGYP